MNLSRRAWAWLALAGTTVGLAWGLARPARAVFSTAADERDGWARPPAVWPTPAQTFTLPTTTTVPAPAPTSSEAPTTAAPPSRLQPTSHPTSKPAPAAPPKPVPVPVVGDLGARIVADARRYLGVPYLWGGTSTAGMDCSGLVYRVLHDLGVNGVPRTADEQMHWTTRISRADAQPGDLVFGVTNGFAHHVGIVIAPGLMIDAPDVGFTVGVHTFYPDSTVFGRVP